MIARIPDLLVQALELGNLILSSVNAVIGFSLFVYVLTNNLRSSVARAFCALIAFVTAVYSADVLMAGAVTLRSAEFWLRAQWLGIAMVPAAYLHFADALLRSMQGPSSRHWGVRLAYTVGVVALALAVATDAIVGPLAAEGSILHLTPGPFFWAFTLYYAVTSLSGWINISRARSLCLTTTSRRRMSYLMLAFVAPSLGVFPYLLLPTAAQALSPRVVSVLTLVGNLGIALMTIVIGYIVAYQGVLLPDRVVKHRLVHFMLRGPLVAAIAISLMLAVPRVESVLGLQRDTVLIFAVAGAIVVMQVLINLGKPALDRLLYRADREEVNRIQRLEDHLLTTTDLEQILENTVLALCELLRAPSGFVVTMQNGQLATRISCGAPPSAPFVSASTLGLVLQQLASSRMDDFVANEDFVQADGHWLMPLKSRADGSTLGILGLRATNGQARFSDDELDAVYGLVSRAELALEDMRLQQRIFGLLGGIDQELSQIQQWRSIPVYAAERGVLQHLDVDPAAAPGFVQAVKEALAQFWGGPKLSKSPLIRMRVVTERMPEHDGVPARAMRSVLQEAIERLRPDGARSLTASEWTLYNILEMRFVQGLRIRDIAARLAMSESDYYRKQRVAIEEVADTLAQMERSLAQRDVTAPDENA
ncbi:MAG: histidine kinase N-terminal 7TM domain-containing protein [Anaerolineae bacterium]|jgi:hypothetical protein